MKEVRAEARLMETIGLENGLTLELYDASRKIAGDRYRVVLTAKIPVPVASAASDPEGFHRNADPEPLFQALGRTVIFEKSMERHFIDAKEKEACLNALKVSFLSSAREYLSRAAFGPRFVLKAYRERMAKKEWYPHERPAGVRCPERKMPAVKAMEKGCPV